MAVNHIALLGVMVWHIGRDLPTLLGPVMRNTIIQMVANISSFATRMSSNLWEVVMASGAHDAHAIWIVVILKMQRSLNRYQKHQQIGTTVAKSKCIR